MFYFISTPGISVMINNEIFINDPNRTPSMSLGNRTGTHIDAGSYTCYVDNS
jgi:kynurenine formamidase